LNAPEPPTDPAPSSGAPRGGGGRAAALGFAAGMAALVALRARIDFAVDDAAITFRYARNWAEWGAPVFNRFELAEGAARVEGYSNLLWMGLLSLLGRVVGFARLGDAALAAQLVATAGTLAVVGRTAARRMALGPAGAFAAPALAGTAAPLVAWSSGGMETALFALLLTALLAAGLADPAPRRGRIALALLAAGVVLVRAEGVLWALGAALAAVVARGRSARAAAVPIAVAAACTFAAQLAWRRATYGAWLPNTVAAKGGGALDETALRGLRHVASWAVVTATPFIALAAAAPALRHGAPAARAGARAALVLAAGGVLYNVAVGGDWMPFFRFLAPITPALALVAAAGIDRVLGRRLPAAVALTAALCALQALPLLGVHVAPEGVRRALQFRGFREGVYETELERVEAARRNREYFETLGEALAAGAPPGATLAFGAIGWTGWRAPDLDLLDRNGLVTPEVARRDAGEARFDDGADTAGHERRVPHAWFLDRGTPPPRYLFATLAPGEVRPASPAFEAMKRALRTRSIVARPAERALFGRTVMRAVPITEGGAAGRTLVLLERAGADEARAFWGP